MTGIITFLLDEEPSEQLVVQLNHVGNVVLEEGVIQIETDTVIVLEAEVRARRRTHGAGGASGVHAEMRAGGMRGMW